MGLDSLVEIFDHSDRVAFVVKANASGVLTEDLHAPATTGGRLDFT